MDRTAAKHHLKFRTVSAALLDEIRNRVLDGSYVAGSQLRQDVIAEEFGVSRIPVREALFQLEAEGLVKIEPHKGATVSTLSAHDIAEAFELRSLLEPKLLKVSGPLLTKDDFAEIEAIISDYTKALKRGDTSVWGDLNTKLHLTLYRRADKPKTLAIVTGLLTECDRYTRVQLSTNRAELERADNEHRELVRLCKEGQIGEATALLRRHISHVAEALSGFLVPPAPAPKPKRGKAAPPTKG
jgi:DNA-binding GntR family transcriptional regulator